MQINTAKEINCSKITILKCKLDSTKGDLQIIMSNEIHFNATLVLLTRK